MDLNAAFPELLPKALSWAETEARRGADDGRALTERECEFARKVGVTHPERIRIVTVEVLPMPTDAPLRAAAAQTGFLNPRMKGLTLGHSVFICRGYETPTVLSHEFRHVYQYEQAGSIAAFLSRYLRERVERGDAATSFDIDATTHERTDL